MTKGVYKSAWCCIHLKPVTPNIHPLTSKKSRKQKTSTQESVQALLQCRRVFKKFPHFKNKKF